MKIFAIDPGNTQSAYCVMDNEYHLIEFAKLPNEEILKKIYERVNDISMVVIERVASYGMAVGREVFETCEWIGRFTQKVMQYALSEEDNIVEYVYRKDEKVTICRSMKAKDANIRQALIDRFAKFDFKNGKGTKSNPDYFYGVSKDCWAAIAVAVTKLDIMKEAQN